MDDDNEEEEEDEFLDDDDDKEEEDDEDEDEDNDDDDNDEVHPARKRQKKDQEHVQDDQAQDDKKGVMKRDNDEVAVKEERHNAVDVYNVDKDGTSGEVVLFKEEDELPVYCLTCGSTPCEWTQLEDEIVEFCNHNHFFVNHYRGKPYAFPTESFLHMTDEKKNEIKALHRSFKKKCYRHFTFLKYGRMGRGNRTQLGPCVENAIRRMFPIHDNSFIGYHSP
jgi:hypothetical protein